jgi:hypothetical protein
VDNFAKATDAKLANLASLSLGVRRFSFGKAWKNRALVVFARIYKTCQSGKLR